MIMESVKLKLNNALSLMPESEAQGWIINALAELEATTKQEGDLSHDVKRIEEAKTLGEAFEIAYASEIALEKSITERFAKPYNKQRINHTMVDTHELASEAFEKGLINEQEALAISCSDYSESDCKGYLTELRLSI